MISIIITVFMVKHMMTGSEIVIMAEVVDGSSDSDHSGASDSETPTLLTSSTSSTEVESFLDRL